MCHSSVLLNARMTLRCYQLALAEGEDKFDSIAEPLSFYQNVSPSKELRDASNEAEKQIRDFGVESSMRLDVYQAKVNAQKNIKASGKWDKLSPEEQRLVEKMVCVCLSA
jgi:Zn-dependent oligopeptidase